MVILESDRVHKTINNGKDLCYFFILIYFMPEQVFVWHVSGKICPSPDLLPKTVSSAYVICIDTGTGVSLHIVILNLQP
jgi:hypothetical protein